MTRELSVEYFFDLSAYAHQELFQNVTYVWDVLKNLPSYLSTQSLGKVEAEVPPAVFLKYPSSITICQGTVVEPGVYIEGPCIIGPNCVIRQGAYIRGNVITGEGCVIGHDTEVKRSILLDRVHAAHFNYIGDSILGSDVNLGAGVKCANYRLDQSFVLIKYKNKKISTESKKVGLIAGDGSQLGCNGVTNPGTLLGKNVLSYPCLNIGGFIPSGAKIKPSQENVVQL